MHLFITGASGYIGGAVARHLVHLGHAVTALARSEASASRLAAEGLGVHLGDLEDAETLRPALARAEGVIHVAVGGPRGVAEADAAALEAMADALAGKDAPLILTSGLGVYAGSQLAVADEETPLDGVTPFQLPRVRLEEQALRAAERGVRVVVLRPGHVYGHGHAGMFTRMQLDYAERTGAGAYVGEGAAPYGTVHADDLAAAYAAALERAPAGSRYNILGHTLTTRELAVAMSHAVSAGGRTVSLTPESAHEAWGPPAGLLMGGPVVSAVKAVVELGWTPRAPILPYELVHGSLRRTGA
jgi:nucleoside-diphosphate-sugar epimerase